MEAGDMGLGKSVERKKRGVKPVERLEKPELTGFNTNSELRV